MIEGLFGPATARAHTIADLDSLHSALLAFSDFVAGVPDIVDVVEINPLVLAVGASRGVLAVDATVRGIAAMPVPDARLAGRLP